MSLQRVTDCIKPTLQVAYRIQATWTRLDRKLPTRPLEPALVVLADVGQAVWAQSLLSLSLRAEGGDYQAAGELAERLKVRPFGRGVRQALWSVPAEDRGQVCRHLAAAGVATALATVDEPQRCKVRYQGRWTLVAGPVQPGQLPLRYFWSWLRWRAGLIAGQQLLEHILGEPVEQYRHWTARTVPLESAPELIDPHQVEDVVTLDALRDDVRALIGAVASPRQRELVDLLLDGYDLQEAAAVLGVDYDTVRVQLHRLRRKLEQHGIRDLL